MIKESGGIDNIETMNLKKLSIIVSLFNEEDGVIDFKDSLIKSICKIQGYFFEILWVNDGSLDNTQLLIEEIKSQVSKANIEHIVIEFSKNFGHEAAMIAGIDHASGDVIICIDSDGQHPPEKIAEMLSAYDKGSDIVLMERVNREDSGILSKLLSYNFYKLLNALSPYGFQQNSTDFFLVSKQVSNVLRTHFRERNRFIRGFIQNIGFSKTLIKFSAPAREKGQSSYSFLNLIKLAVNALFSFSNRPLRLALMVSFAFIIFTMFFMIYTLYMFFYGNTPPSGYTSIILFLSISFSLLFILLTILSIYFEKSLSEIRKRPIYIVKKLNR